MEAIRNRQDSYKALNKSQTGDDSMGKLVFSATIMILCVVVWSVLGRVQSRVRPDDARNLGYVRSAVFHLGWVTPLLIIVFSSWVVVRTGHVGVVLLFDKVQPRPLYEGFNVIAPWYDVVQLSTQVKKKVGRFDAASKDLQTVHVEMAINARLIPDQAPRMYQTVGSDYENVIISPAEQEVLKAHTALYNASDILHQRPKLKSEVQADLAAWLLKYGIELREASLSNIAFDPAYAKAIEAKQVQEQAAEQKRYEVIGSTREAEKVRESAKGTADKAREEAKGDADALRLRGAAQAEYNAKVSASLTPALIQQQWIEAWKGGGAQVPHVNGGGSFLLQMPIPELKK